MKVSTLFVVALVLAVGVIQNAKADDDIFNQQIELFPLADMDSQINDSLQTSIESKTKASVLVIKADKDLRALPSAQSNQRAQPGEVAVLGE